MLQYVQMTFPSVTPDKFKAFVENESNQILLEEFLDDITIDCVYFSLPKPGSLAVTKKCFSKPLNLAVLAQMRQRPWGGAIRTAVCRRCTHECLAGGCADCGASSCAWAATPFGTIWSRLVRTMRTLRYTPPP